MIDDPYPYQSIQSAEVGADYRVSEGYLNKHPEQRPGYRYAPREKYNEYAVARVEDPSTPVYLKNTLEEARAFVESPPLGKLRRGWVVITRPKPTNPEWKELSVTYTYKNAPGVIMNTNNQAEKDEREALNRIITAVDEGTIPGQPDQWWNIFSEERDQIVEAILASEVWRNRGEGVA